MATGKDGTKPFKYQAGSYSYTVGGWVSKVCTRSNLGLSIPSGYTPFSLMGFNSGSNWCMVSYARPTNSDTFRIYNRDSDSSSGSASFRLMYVPNTLI